MTQQHEEILLGMIVSLTPVPSRYYPDELDMQHTTSPTPSLLAFESVNSNKEVSPNCCHEIAGHWAR